MNDPQTDPQTDPRNHPSQEAIDMANFARQHGYPLDAQRLQQRIDERKAHADRNARNDQ